MLLRLWRLRPWRLSLQEDVLNAVVSPRFLFFDYSKFTLLHEIGSVDVKARAMVVLILLSPRIHRRLVDAGARTL